MTDSHSTGLIDHTAIDGIIAPLERPTPSERNYKVGYNDDTDRASLIKVKILHETGQIISYRLGKHRFRTESLYALKHGTIENAVVDKDGLSLHKVENLHETGQSVSYRLEKHRFRLEILRLETWDH